MKMWRPLVCALWSAGLVMASVGVSADEQRYGVKVEATELEVDTRGALTFIVEGQNDFLLDRDFPAELRFIPEVGDEVLAAKKTDYGKEDASYAEDDSSMRWKVEMTARRRGAHPVRLEAKFRVCREDDCQVAASNLRLKVVVKSD